MRESCSEPARESCSESRPAIFRGNVSAVNASVNEPTRVTELAVGGMNCGNCARHVAEALQEVEGVEDVQVRLEQGRATVRWKGAVQPTNELLTAAVQAAGYRARVLEAEGPAGSEAAPSPLAAWRFNVLFGALLTAPLLIGEWVLGLGHETWFHYVGFALAAPVLAVCGRGFFVGAWRQLQRGASNMDTLVALGSSAAFGYSTWALLQAAPGHLYFLEAAAIVTLISTGHWLEAIAGARAAGALRALIKLAPPTARRRQPDGSDAEVPVADLEAGDEILLKPGDRVPVDAVVTDGASAVDESMLTGESLPIEKAPGAPLYAGTVNRNGRLVARVTATGEATALAHIIAVVQRAQSSRARIQRLADRISNVFVPVVVLVALATGLWWALDYDGAQRFRQVFLPFLPHGLLPATPLAAAFIHATAVLIVACPCAMGLATPAAILAGTNAAARRGILIRDGQALEKSGTLTTVVFDKTGTLTRGQASVVAEHTLVSPPNSTLHALLAGLAASSNHPLSVALADWARRSAPETAPLALRAWEELRGQGIQASWSGATLRLGSLRWLHQCHVNLDPGTAFAGEWTTQGATVIGLAQDQSLLGLFALRDELKPNAADIVAQLTARGLRVAMLTGDQHGTALAIARAAGIPADRVLAEVPPDQKAARLETLQSRGERVAFVGDGINDAPALEQAALGIAVSKASDVAREAADVILLQSDLQAIPEAIELAQATLRTIRQNLFWAFFYNAAAIPLAALGFLSPIVCALAMGLSDLIVIGNALRLLRWRQPAHRSSQSDGG